MSFEECVRVYDSSNVEYMQLVDENKVLKEKVSELEAENARLKELLKLNQKRQFGKKSESSPPPDEPENKVSVSAHTRSAKRGRIIETKHMPRHKMTHDLPESEKICPCCQHALHEIGSDVSEKIEVIPAHYVVVEHVRLKYGCRNCRTVHMAPKPLSPIPKSLAGASLLTDILINKYQYHLPLYRQSKIMASYGLTIPDNTLGNWVMQSGEALLKLYDALWCILKSHYLQVDETPVKILEPDKKGYLWTYYAPPMGLVVFEISETRSGSVASDRLRDFKGLLQTDGYAGYNALRSRPGIVGLGCLSHARRKFDEALKISNDKTGIAGQMIERMKPLYVLEAQMRGKHYDFRCATKAHLR